MKNLPDMKKNVNAIENRETFEARLRQIFTEENFERIMFAYQLAKDAHRGQMNANGEVRHFEDIRAGCLIMMDELGLYDLSLLVAYLLHCAGESTALFGDIRQDYGAWKKRVDYRVGFIWSSARDIVIALTKPPIEPSLTDGDMSGNGYSYTQGLIINDDAAFLKMIDLLVQLRHAEGLPAEKAKVLIEETEAIYLPIFESLSQRQRTDNGRPSVSIFLEMKKRLVELKVKFMQTHDVWMLNFNWDEYDGDEWGPSYESATIYYTSETRLLHDMTNWKPGYLYTNVGMPSQVKVSKEMYDAIVQAGGRKKIR